MDSKIGESADLPKGGGVLVVGGPQRDGGVVLQPPHLVPHLGLDLLEIWGTIQVLDCIFH